MKERIEKQILSALSSGKKSVYELIYYQDSSLKEFLDIIQNLRNKKIIRMENGFLELTGRGKKIAKNVKFIETKCKYCNGTGFIVSDFFRKILKTYSKICEKRPEAIEKYDQGFIDPEGVIKRIEFIYECGDIYGKIFVLGDDDLFSIACSLTKFPKFIFVAEIDERIVEFINKIAKKYKLNVKAMIYDAQKNLPKFLRRKFDVFVTDPVETIDGLKLFFSRCVSSLKGVGSSGYFGITQAEASRKKWYKIQKMIYEMGFVITDIKKKFNIYPDTKDNFFRFQEKLPIFNLLKTKTDFNWYSSSLYRIEAVKEPKPLITREMKINEKMYKDDESLATPY